MVIVMVITSCNLQACFLSIENFFLSFFFCMRMFLDFAIVLGITLHGNLCCNFFNVNIVCYNLLLLLQHVGIIIVVVVVELLCTITFFVVVKH